MPVKEQKVLVALKQLINTGNYENIEVFCEREATLVDTTPEEVGTVKKELFEECVKTVQLQAKVSLKKLGKEEQASSKKES